MPARTHERILSIKLEVLNIRRHIRIRMRLGLGRLFRMRKFSPLVPNSYLIRPKLCETIFVLKTNVSQEFRGKYDTLERYKISTGTKFHLFGV
jgi:hypothetical protein